LATAQLLGHDDPGVRMRSRLPLLVEGCEIPNIESEKGPALGCGECKLFFVGGGVFAGFFRSENVVAAAAQIDGQAGHDMAVEVEPNEKGLKAG